jgi:uncharacterized membrane protein
VNEIPWHPLAVHLPLALAVLWPLACVALLMAIRLSWVPTRAWWAIVVLAGLLAGSTLVAVETGEGEEERVERVVPHDAVEEHEEAGEWLLWSALAGLAMSVVGLVGSTRATRAARFATLVAALVVLAAALRAGHLGGRLVYVHGAASAYTEPGAAQHEEHEHDED